MTDKIRYEPKHIDRERLVNEIDKTLRKIDDCYMYTKRESKEMINMSIDKEGMMGMSELWNAIREQSRIIYDVKVKMSAGYKIGKREMKEYEKAIVYKKLLKNQLNRIRMLRREIEDPIYSLDTEFEFTEEDLKRNGLENRFYITKRNKRRA